MDFLSLFSANHAQPAKHAKTTRMMARSDNPKGVNTTLARMIPHQTLQISANTKPTRRLQMKRPSMIKPNPIAPWAKTVAVLPSSDRSGPISNSISSVPAEVIMAKNATEVVNQAAQRMKEIAPILVVIVFSMFLTCSLLSVTLITQA